MPILRILSLLLLLYCTPAWPAGANSFIYPAPEIANDTRINDLLEVLRTALDKTRAEYGPYDLHASQLAMPKARYLAALQEEQEINIIWTSTSQDMENQFLPVRIPLRHGLLGYRIALIAKDQQEKIDQVKTIADLKKLSIGQGPGWGDSAVYEAYGMNVTRAKYANLFAMTASKRFDLFPRGVTEVFAEFEQFSKDNPNLAIEKNLLLYYPWPYYFFFNKNNTKAAQRLELGMRRMIKDGSFQAIIEKYHAKALAQANLKGRRLIFLKNPLLPKNTPLHDASLWHDPRQQIISQQGQ